MLTALNSVALALFDIAYAAALFGGLCLGLLALAVLCSACVPFNR